VRDDADGQRLVECERGGLNRRFGEQIEMVVVGVAGRCRVEIGGELVKAGSEFRSSAAARIEEQPDLVIGKLPFAVRAAAPVAAVDHVRSAW